MSSSAKEGTDEVGVEIDAVLCVFVEGVWLVDALVCVVATEDVVSVDEEAVLGVVETSERVDSTHGVRESACRSVERIRP